MQATYTTNCIYSSDHRGPQLEIIYIFLSHFSISTDFWTTIATYLLKMTIKTLKWRENMGTYDYSWKFVFVCLIIVSELPFRTAGMFLQ